MKNYTIQSLSLKRKLWIAFSLVTILPSFLFLYYIKGYNLTPFTIFIAILIIFSGWWIIFEMVISILRTYSRMHSRLDLNDFNTLHLFSQDEITGLNTVIENLSSKVKSSLEQLKEFSEKTEKLNKEISQKMLTLTTILQMNELFYKNIPWEEIIKFLIPRIKDIISVDCVFFISYQQTDRNRYDINVLGADGIEVSVLQKFIESHYDDIVSLKTAIWRDSRSKNKVVDEWQKELAIKNILLKPLISFGKNIGILGVGSSKDDCVFNKDILSTINIFTNNIGIIWEYKNLLSKVEEMEVFDSLTGFYNEKFIIARLNEEIKRAQLYRRPCGFLVVEITNYEGYQKKYGIIKGEKLIKKVGEILKDIVGPIDILGRLSANRLGVILIEKNKRQSQAIAGVLKEKIRRGTIGEDVSINIGVAENPLDGVSPVELLMSIENQLKSNEIR